MSLKKSSKLNDKDVKLLKVHFLTKEEFLDYRDEINQLMFEYKSDIMDKMDDFITEIRKSRDEQTVLSHHVSTHTDQIERIEKKVGLLAFEI